MKRYLDMATFGFAIVAAAALAGCGSETGTGAAPGTTSSSSGSDGGSVADGSSSGAGGDASSSTDGTSSSGSDATAGGSDGSSSGTDTAAAVDAGPQCTAANQATTCKAGEFCKEGSCVKAPPCWDSKENKPACKAGELCSTKDDPKGKCVTPTCKLPDKWSVNVNKVSKLEIPSENTNACDLNDDGKNDNALGAALKTFASQIKGALDDNLSSGKLVIALEADNWKTDKTKFSIRTLLGEIDPSQAGTGGKPTCDPLSATANCKYVVNESSYDQFFNGGSCPAVVDFQNAEVDKTKLKAGGDTQKFILSIPILSIELNFVLNKVTLKGDVKGDTAWTETKTGKICGLLKKEDIDKAIESIPDAELESLGGKDVVKSIVAGVLKADIDDDGDGTKESVSTYIELETVPGTIVGFKK